MLKHVPASASESRIFEAVDYGDSLDPDSVPGDQEREGNDTTKDEQKPEVEYTAQWRVVAEELLYETTCGYMDEQKETPIRDFKNWLDDKIHRGPYKLRMVSFAICHGSLGSMRHLKGSEADFPLLLNHLRSWHLNYKKSLYIIVKGRVEREDPVPGVPANVAPPRGRTAQRQSANMHTELENRKIDVSESWFQGGTCSYGNRDAPVYHLPA